MIVAGTATMAFVALVVFALTFVPTKLTLPAADPGGLPMASPPAGMTLSALPTGSYDSPAALTFRGGSWRDTRHLAATAVLVHHPRGNLLIDAGFGRQVDRHMLLLPFMQRSPHTRETPALDRLTANGVRSVDIAAIIPTHAHWDHVSGLDDLRGVPVLETAAGMRFINSGANGTEVIRSIRGVAYQQYRFEGKSYLGFPRSHDVWGDGSVVIVPAPGHTPDSVVVFVNLSSGNRYAFIGDVVFQKEGIDRPAEKPWMLRWLIGEDRGEVDMDIARLRAAKNRYPQIHIIPAHDMSAFQILPVFPAFAK